jgi:hypothetical protein
MSWPKIITRSVLLTLLISISCNAPKKEDPAESIAAFLALFQKSLSLPDEKILELFETTQSRESILTAVHILQNKEDKYIECLVNFASSTSVHDANGYFVSLTALLRPINVDHKTQAEAVWSLVLKPKDKSYVIQKIDADEFYKTFADIRNQITWDVEIKEETEKRVSIYTKAKELQQHYDSVVWFTHYGDATYFYVVKGVWNVDKYQKDTAEYQIGIVDEHNHVILPVEYDHIGTIGFDDENIVEVGKNGKVGYFDIAAKAIVIPVEYDMIIPRNDALALAIVKKDSTYGFIDNERNYNVGFPDRQIQAWVNSFGFLPAKLNISNANKSLCEIPNESNIGAGYAMPPSYLVKTGLFPTVVRGISTTKVPMQGWTEFVETKGSVMKQVTEGVNAVITAITERYLEGREEFYTENRLVFVNAKNDTLSASNISTDGEIEIRRIGENLLEIKSTPNYAMGTDLEDNWNVPRYTYFSIDASSVRPLPSKRYFKMTEFVKLDSSYLSGNFKWWDTASNEEKETTFLSIASITYMRNEILAYYGYKFTEEEELARFNHRDYKVRFESLEECVAAMSEIDRYNFEFLEKILTAMKVNQV